jgi:hypothetical protein
MYLWEEDPRRWRLNVLLSWQVVREFAAHVRGDWFVAHLDPIQGVVYDCLGVAALHKERGWDIPFLLNRNGVNSNILANVWERAQRSSPLEVARELARNSENEFVEVELSSISVDVCDAVIAWIQEHSDQTFFAGPIGWYGAPTKLIAPPLSTYNKSLWPVTDHGPELILAIDGQEVERIYAHTGDILKS